MRRAVGSVLSALLLLGLACAGQGGSRRAVATPPAPAAPRPTHAVAIRLSLPTPPSLGWTGDWSARDERGAERGRGSSLPAATPLKVTLAGVLLGEHNLGPPPVRLQAQGSGQLLVGGRRYRGALRIEYDLKSGRAQLVNELPLEDYLLGVVPSEMPDRFGLEALKAQAVAARSYALAEFAERGYLWGDTRSQAYGGVTAETPLGTRAVRETAGQTLEHQGSTVNAYYHSTCGGRTAPARALFAAAAAGVMDEAVECPDCRDSPYYRWTRRFEVARVCVAAGLTAAPLSALTVPPDQLPGRPSLVTVLAGEQLATLRAEELRSRLSQGRPLAEQMLSTSWRSAPQLEGGLLVVEGGGFGHGVGLCQYGAAGFAARGAGYEAILARYYPGAQLAGRP
ncbi:MAG: SpoIID/LytB domain-containing protein [Planctomycetota bacterium]